MSAAMALSIPGGCQDNDCATMCWEKFEGLRIAPEESDKDDDENDEDDDEDDEDEGVYLSLFLCIIR